MLGQRLLFTLGKCLRLSDFTGINQFSEPKKNTSHLAPSSYKIFWLKNTYDSFTSSLQRTWRTWVWQDNANPAQSTKRWHSRVESTLARTKTLVGWRRWRNVKRNVVSSLHVTYLSCWREAVILSGALIRNSAWCSQLGSRGSTLPSLTSQGGTARAWNIQVTWNQISFMLYLFSQYLS